MQSYRNRRREPTIPTGRILFILLVLAVPGCNKDGTSPTSPSTSSSSVTGHWVGTGRIDNGPAYYTHDLSIVGDITQSGNSLGGNWLWTITSSTLGSGVVGRRTRMWFKGQLTSATVISLQETSLVSENWNGQGLDVSNYTATLSSTKDTIRLTNVLPAMQQYPITTGVIVKQ
jgi:hypothetical protein